MSQLLSLIAERLNTLTLKYLMAQFATTSTSDGVVVARTLVRR